MVIVFTASCGSGNNTESNSDNGSEATVSEERPGFGTLKDEDIVVGFSLMGLSNPFFISVQEGGQAYCDDRGYPAHFASAEYNAEKQISDIESLMSLGVNVLDCRVTDTTAVKDKLIEARAAGIAINTFPFMEESDTVVAYDNYEQGEKLATALVEWAKKNGKEDIEVALLTHPTVEAELDRQRAFRDVIERELPNATVVIETEANTTEMAVDVTENILQAYPNCKAFLCISDAAAMGVNEVVKQHDPNNLKDYWTGGIDGIDAALELVAQSDTDSVFRCTIAGEYYVQELSWMILDNLVKAAKGEEFIHLLPMPVIAVTIDNVKEYTERPIDYKSLPTEVGR
jgi:ribose transport system substrate-binding protein